MAFWQQLLWVCQFYCPMNGCKLWMSTFAALPSVLLFDSDETCGQWHFHFHNMFLCCDLSCLRSNMLEAICADTAALQAFWKQQKHLGMLDSSCFDFDWENELPVPWNLHGDAAPFTEVDSLKVVSMRCPLSSLEVEHSQLMLAALPKQLGRSYLGKLSGLESPSPLIVGICRAWS